MRAVVDASVVLRWVWPDQFAEHALWWAANCDPIAPDLIWPEMANAITTGVRAGRLSAGEGKTLMRDLRLRGIQCFSAEPIIERALELACALRHSAYDCLYLALAEIEGVRLVTADRAFYKRIVEAGFAAYGAWIERPADPADQG